ncbi:Aquaporin [Datura stramonium]|uniref:Aquaporin n=1 Tax=Datura stramonium TaxID=4076 RepID=A0ABS8VQK2_DATST|nr:Aquaporin [Datura stramonium]
MAISRIAIGDFSEITKRDALKAAVAEFICTLTFVFPAEGANLLFGHIIKDGGLPNAMFGATLSHAFGLFAGVAAAASISGGHASPAITFAALLGGHITLFRSVLYFIAQMLGALSAVYLLMFANNGLRVSIYPPTNPWSAVLYEVVMMFLLAYTYYATSFDPKKAKNGIMSPLAIGLMVGANLLSGGGLSGGAMNPAIAFAQAFISWTWSYHWVYWLGTFGGAGLGAVVYETIFMDDHDDIYEQLPITMR